MTWYIPSNAARWIVATPHHIPLHNTYVTHQGIDSSPWESYSDLLPYPTPHDHNQGSYQLSLAFLSLSDIIIIVMKTPHKIPIYPQGTLLFGINNGPHQYNKSFISGHVNSYGALLANGLRSFRFCCNMSVWHPYGSVWYGNNELFFSPFVDSIISNPVDDGGSTPT